MHATNDRKETFEELLNILFVIMLEEYNSQVSRWSSERPVLLCATIYIILGCHALFTIIYAELGSIPISSLIANQKSKRYYTGVTHK